MVIENLAYELTKFDIPAAREISDEGPAICPHCHLKDWDSFDYVGTTKCPHCGMLYWIKRRGTGPW